MATNLNNMGFQFGLDNMATCFPVKFRWLFSINEVSADLRGGHTANCLPPMKGARPNFNFKTKEVPHLVETVHYPIRPEWKPIQLVLYDIKTNINPVFTWIKKVYDAQTGAWKPPAGSDFMREGKLCLYSGCGDILQQWTFDDCWPEAANWGELDMGSSEVVTVDVTLRYARAYFIEPDVNANLAINTRNNIPGGSGLFNGTGGTLA